MVQIKLPKEGSKWSSVSDTFIVLHTIELNGHVWVHYRKELDSLDYSCYLESFLDRFSEIV
jgi:hypothetical protein